MCGAAYRKVARDEREREEIEDGAARHGLDLRRVTINIHVIRPWYQLVAERRVTHCVTVRYHRVRKLMRYNVISSNAMVCTVPTLVPPALTGWAARLMACEPGASLLSGISAAMLVLLVVQQVLGYSWVGVRCGGWRRCSSVPDVSKRGCACLSTNFPHFISLLAHRQKSN